MAPKGKSTPLAGAYQKEEHTFSTYGRNELHAVCCSTVLTSCHPVPICSLFL